MMYRNEKLTRLIGELGKDREIPCQNCGKADGTVVGCHANMSWMGRGHAHKAHDLVAAMCFTCHHMLDFGSGMKRSEKEEMWMKAALKTLVHLLLRDHIAIEVKR